MSNRYVNKLSCMAIPMTRVSLPLSEIQLAFLGVTHGQYRKAVLWLMRTLYYRG